jgi:hypothetical protein
VADTASEILQHIQAQCVDWGSSAGIATRYGLAVRGSNPGRGESFRNRSRTALGPDWLLIQWVLVFIWGKAAEAWP